MQNVVVSYGDLSRQTGYRTRVVGELEHLDRKSGLSTSLLVFDRQPAAFRNGFASQIPCRVHHRRAVIRFYQEMAKLSRREPVRLVHAHNLYSAALALSARWFFGYKVVLDYHGRVPEEYVFLGKGGQASRKALERLERWAVTGADHIITVSEKLRDYVRERYRQSQPRLSVIPCCADSRQFRWNTDRREEARRRLGLQDKIVVTHLGSMFDWYEPDLMIRVFQRLQTYSAKSHLLIVTGSAREASDYLAARLRPETFTVTSVSHDQVPALLNASDLGLLLLRSSPNIKTSSPAKFSEYLNSGLPVIITPDVGDFSDLVRATGTGVVVADGEPDLTILHRILSERLEYAALCVAAGQGLQWESYEASWQATVRRLTGSASQ
jgi:glycosyltransferase involved in cell wall biosynthesis